MASQTSPVTPAVVRWAVQEDGRSLQELATALKVDVDTLDGWTSGDHTVTRGQVTDLARVLQRPRALFFLPSPPVSAALPASFRHPAGEDKSVSAQARKKVRQARRIQHAVSWALRNEAPVEMPRGRPGDDSEEVAGRIRRWLGISHAEQSAWKDDRAALRAWRNALEDKGVLVFMLEIGRDDVRGFSAWDDHAPLIVCNLSGVNPAARIYTIAHELGHLASRDDYACGESVDVFPAVGVERWCERFGAALLMPRTEVGMFARERRIAGRSADIDDVRVMMRTFRVSARAAALRLIDLRYAHSNLYTEAKRTFAPPPPSASDKPMARPPRAVARVREYGPATLRTVLTALPPRDALSTLRVTVEDVRRIADEVPGVPAAI